MYSNIYSNYILHNPDLYRKIASFLTLEEIERLKKINKNYQNHINLELKKKEFTKTLFDNFHKLHLRELNNDDMKSIIFEYMNKTNYILLFLENKPSSIIFIENIMSLYCLIRPLSIKNKYKDKKSIKLLLIMIQKSFEFVKNNENENDLIKTLVEKLFDINNEFHNYINTFNLNLDSELIQIKRYHSKLINLL